MAKYLVNTMHMHTLVLLSYLVLNMHSALAGEVLRDPTQLPQNTMPMPNQTNIPSTYDGPVLQSVMLSDSVKAAIINGKQIRLGQAYNQATLIALTENTATLKAADGIETVLKMPHMMIKKNEKQDAIANR